MPEIGAAVPPGVEMHLVTDNYAMHRVDKVRNCSTVRLLEIVALRVGFVPSSRNRCTKPLRGIERIGYWRWMKRL
jgi:hypothetical protein